MDAKSLLRRYIEQRRELGESELVLDSLNVEDVRSEEHSLNSSH